MNRIPLELCEKIVEFACSNDAATARSLSLVSRFIHDISKRFERQQVVIRRQDRMIAFADLLDQTPELFQHLRSLIICWEAEDIWQDRRCATERLQEETREGEEAERRKKMIAKGEKEVEGGHAFEKIFRKVADRLEILEVQLDERVAGRVPGSVALPRLTDLTIHGLLPFGRDDTRILETCHSLRRLHVNVDGKDTSSDNFEDIISFAPALTHLCFSGLRGDKRSIRELESALRLGDSADPNHRTGWARTTRRYRAGVNPEDDSNVHSPLDTWMSQIERQSSYDMFIYRGRR